MVEARVTRCSCSMVHFCAFSPSARRASVIPSSEQWLGMRVDVASEGCSATETCTFALEVRRPHRMPSLDKLTSVSSIEDDMRYARASRKTTPRQVTVESKGVGLVMHERLIRS